MKLLSVVGARPQFIKAATLCRALRSAQHEEVLVHTGQHYDYAMSEVFFEELGIPAPKYNLGVGSAAHGAQTAQMLAGIEKVLQSELPKGVIVYGDTNSTLAGALAAAKLHIPVIHVEAGLRSFNRRMPEEINRVLTDHLSTLLMCPTQTAIDNLRTEGICNGVFLVGDVMEDGFYEMAERAGGADVLEKIGSAAGEYYLATVHRAENTDDPNRLVSILSAFAALGERVIFPVHPRTRKKITDLVGTIHPLREAKNVQLIDPVGYLEMVALEKHARMILTDSGGVQKEAYWLGVPCVTLREETEWVETVSSGWNRLAGTDTGRILSAAREGGWPSPKSALDERRGAARAVVARMEELL
jgi:UDP-N-acetylglucosamine 2-epimerase